MENKKEREQEMKGRGKASIENQKEQERCAARVSANRSRRKIPSPGGHRHCKTLASPCLLMDS